MHNIHAGFNFNSSSLTSSRTLGKLLKCPSQGVGKKCLTAKVACRMCRYRPHLLNKYPKRHSRHVRPPPPPYPPSPPHTPRSHPHPPHAHSHHYRCWSSLLAITRTLSLQDHPGRTRHAAKNTHKAQRGDTNTEPNQSSPRPGIFPWLWALETAG